MTPIDNTCNYTVSGPNLEGAISHLYKDENLASLSIYPYGTIRGSEVIFTDFKCAQSCVNRINRVLMRRHMFEYII